MEKLKSAAASWVIKGLSLPDEGYARQPAVLRVVPFSRSTLWLKVKRGEFPAPVKLSERVTAWRVGDVRRWIAERDTKAA